MRLHSDHTILINKFICLCQAKSTGKQTQKPWPNPLYDLGYRVKLIEQEIRMRGGGIVHPDVLAVSNQHLHVLVAECKSGNNINADQDRRYASLETADLANFVKLHDRNQLKHDVCYVDGAENHASLDPHTNLPFITFGCECIQKHGTFQLDKLDKKLSLRITLDGSEILRSYYKFSPSDGDKFVVPHVLRALMRCVVSTDPKSRVVVLELGAATKITQVLDPQNIISRKHKKWLQKRVERVLNMLLQRDEFADLVRRAGESDPAAARTLWNKCGEISSEYETQGRITDSFER